MEQARELDPLSIIINANIGLVYYYARQPDRAIETELRALELDPNAAFIYEYLGTAYLQKGMYRGAIGHLQKAVGLSNGFPLARLPATSPFNVAGVAGSRTKRHPSPTKFTRFSRVNKSSPTPSRSLRLRCKPTTSQESNTNSRTR
jgi:tetratricopeptide (TPR) repeat protein